MIEYVKMRRALRFLKYFIILLRLSNSNGSYCDLVKIKGLLDRRAFGEKNRAVKQTFVMAS